MSFYFPAEFSASIVHSLHHYGLVPQLSSSLDMGFGGKKAVA